jgi:hypothetical protein
MMNAMYNRVAWLFLAAVVAGCAGTSQGVNDLSGSTDDLGVEDLGDTPDMTSEDLVTLDLMVVCDVDAGFRLCVDKCISTSECCTSSDCPGVANGQGVCTNNVCGFSCGAGFKGCGSKCIPQAGCCQANECTLPADPCQTAIGATCVNNACNYLPLVCPYQGQTCTNGICNCAPTEKVCQTAGKCIPNATCCTNPDCAAITGQVCPMPGGTCSCLAGNKPCSASNSCIAQSSCCTVADCTFAGQTCSGVGGTCSCPAGQKPCGANNSCIANTQCCTTADCSGGQTCPMAGGSCGCPSGQYLCTTICIPSSTCCTNANCPSGQVCSGIMGTCSCPSGTKFCAASGTCIPNANCCASSECTAIPGQVCSAPGGSCVCAGGTKLCGSSCIPNASCCTVSDCAVTSNVASRTCNSGTCVISSCNGGWANPNGAYGDGCECAQSAWGKSCGSATSLGTLGLNGLVQRSGTLPTSGEENWFLVTFTYTSASNYHPSISISSQAGNAFVFDVFTGCGFNVLTCGNGGDTTNRTGWDVFGGGEPSGLTWSPTPSVGTVYIRVRRASGGVTCGQYTLTVSNT